MQGGEKGKTIHPKTKGLKRRKKPTQEQSISTVQTKQHRERGKKCEGGDTQTQIPVPSGRCVPEAPQQTAPVLHATAPAPVHCLRGGWVLSPTQKPSNGDLQRQILENHPEGSWGKQNPAGK